MMTQFSFWGGLSLSDKMCPLEMPKYQKCAEIVTSSPVFPKQHLWVFVAWVSSLEAASGAMPHKMAAHLFLSAVTGCSGAEHPAVYTTDEAAPARWLPFSGCTSHGTWCPWICHGSVIDLVGSCSHPVSWVKFPITL